MGVQSGFLRVEGVESEPWEARRGPNKGQLEPKIGQNLQSKKLYKSRTLVERALDSYMEIEKIADFYSESQVSPRSIRIQIMMTAKVRSSYFRL